MNSSFRLTSSGNSSFEMFEDHRPENVAVDMPFISTVNSALRHLQSNRAEAGKQLPQFLKLDMLLTFCQVIAGGRQFVCKLYLEVTPRDFFINNSRCNLTKVKLLSASSLHDGLLYSLSFTPSQIILSNPVFTIRCERCLYCHSRGLQWHIVD